MKKFWKRTEGFTLVELIVVIAILGILAGIGTVGYSGYVKKANMAADQQLVRDVVYATELAAVSGEKMEGVATVILRQNAEAVVEGSTATAKAWMDGALTDVFGSEYKPALALQYGQWGKGAIVTKNTVTHFVNSRTDANLGPIYEGLTNPTFAGDVDDLFVLLKNTAVDVGSNLDQSGANLVQGAADYTTEKGQTNSNFSGEFAMKWATDKWDNTFLGSNDTDYENAGDLDKDTQSGALEAAVANAAVIKARNTAFATYLRNEGYEEAYTLVADYTYSGGVIPRDAVGAFMGKTSDSADFLNKFDACFGESERSAARATGISYFDSVNGAPSAAAIDGLAYYAMMDTVTKVNNNNTSDETYWDEMSSAVSLYGSIATGDVDLDDLKAMYDATGTVEENSVAVTVMGVTGGVSINISPATAMPG